MPLYDFFSIEYGVGLDDQIIHSIGLTSLVLQMLPFSRRRSMHSLYYIADYKILFGVESA